MKAAALTSLALRNVPQDRMGAGSGLFSMARDLAPSLGVSIGLAFYSYLLMLSAGSILTDKLREFHLDIAAVEPLLRGFSDKAYEIPDSVLAQFMIRGIDVNEFLDAVKHDAMNNILPTISNMLFVMAACCVLLVLMLSRLSKQETLKGNPFEEPVG